MARTPHNASAMRETMSSQAEVLAGLLSDAEPPARAAERLRGRRILLIGTGRTQPNRAPVSCD